MKPKRPNNKGCTDLFMPKNVTLYKKETIKKKNTTKIPQSRLSVLYCIKI